MRGQTIWQRGLTALFAAVFMAALLVGCGQEAKQAAEQKPAAAGSYTFTDQAGNEVTVKAPVERMVVLRLHAQGIGILMTTHFPDHALYLSAETLVLKDKTLWKHGTAAEVIDEAGMSALYGLPVHIAQIGTRTVCVGGEIG